MQQQVIERYGAPRAFDGGLKIKTTLDLDLQRAAEQSVNGYLAYSGDPTASLVAIENSTGEVRAMVGGRNYDESPFNLATEGERQPGSSFKAFDLAAALEHGISPDSEWPSKEKTFYVHGPHGIEKFVVHNDEGAYTGENTLTGAIAYSDNSIFAEVGLKVGTTQIADLAHRMGITTPISTNPAMTIGGLSIGVTPLDMAHAYETIAHGGQRVSGTLAEDDAPVGIQEVVSPAPARSPTAPTATSTRCGPNPCCPPASPRPRPKCSRPCSSTAPPKPPRSASSRPARPARRPTTSTPGSSAGTTSTRSPCGSATRTALIPMTTDFDGGPVLGGTFPALIWHDFMISALGIEKERAEHTAPPSAAPAPPAPANRARAPPKRPRRRARGRRRARPRRRRRARARARKAPASPPRPVGPAAKPEPVRPAPGRRTRTRRLAGAGDTHARSPERAFLPLLTRAVHAGGGLLALADGRGQRRGLAGLARTGIWSR